MKNLEKLDSSYEQLSDVHLAAGYSALDSGAGREGGNDDRKQREHFVVFLNCNFDLFNATARIGKNGCHTGTRKINIASTKKQMCGS